MALSGIRITDLPEDTSLIQTGDTFIKVKNVGNIPTSFKVDGSVFQNSFQGITGVNSLGGGYPFYSGVTPDNSGLNFNTLKGSNGIDINKNSHVLTLQVSGTNFVTSSMIQPNTITSSQIANNSITNNSIATNTIQYSNLLNSSSYQGAQQRLSKIWVNFDGTKAVNYDSTNSNSLSGVRSSHGVLGVVRLNKPGVYQINFNFTMNDAYYAVIGNANDPSGIATVTVNAQQPTYCQIQVDRTSPLETYDVSNVSVIIFGN